MWRGFISAVQFLTIVPYGNGTAFNARAAIPFFPIVGLAIGGLLAVIDGLSLHLWPRPIVAVIDLVALVVLSGALHLDGLADTADGIYGRRSPAQALAIMKDSRIGAIGSVALVCCLAVKWAGLYGLNDQRGLYLFVVPAFARASILFGMRLLPYGRPDGGTGHAFFTSQLTTRDFWSLPLLLILALVAGGKAMPLLFFFALITTVLLLIYKRRMGCITGDMLGAMIEINEAGLFLVLAAGIIA